MTKHRTITGFVAVALLAAAATAATMRPLSTERAIASTGAAALQVLTPDVKKLGSQDVEDQSLRAKRPVRYEAIIANWKRYHSATKPNE